MLTQGDTLPDASNAVERTRELEDILHYNQNILDRLAGFEERLCLLKGRLSGSSPKETTEGLTTDGPDGIMGQLQSTHLSTSTRCDTIAKWLDDIERVV